MSDPTGYSGEGEDSPREPQLWSLERATPLTSSQLVGLVMMGDRHVGTIYFNSEEDFKWLKKHFPRVQRFPNKS